MRRRHRSNSAEPDESTSSDVELNGSQLASGNETDEYMERAEREIASAIGEAGTVPPVQREIRDN